MYELVKEMPLRGMRGSSKVALAMLCVCIISSDGFATSFRSPSPFEITIEDIGGSGQVHIEEKNHLFFLKKGKDLILVIPKDEPYGDEGITFRHKEHFYGAFTIPNTIHLKSNNPNVLLCYWINPYKADQQYECKTEVTTNVAKIDVKPQKLSELAKMAGVLDRETTILSFRLDGEVDGESFQVNGSVSYDPKVKER